MTTSPRVGLLGEATPRLLVEPHGVRENSWEDVTDLLASFGLTLDPWQESVLQAAMGERTDGLWAAKQVALSAPRQNGKSMLIVARAIAGALLFGERKIVISAHQQDTARETFDKFITLIEDSPALESRLYGGDVHKGVMFALGREHIKFSNGAKVQFKARTGAGSRGFSADCLFLDEAQILGARAWASINSTMSARENPQAWLLGTPPTPEDDSEVFTKIREAAIEGNTTTLAYVEYSADPKADPKLVTTWASANPAWYTRINHDVVRGEYDSYSPEQFAMERLGIWQVGGSVPRVINADRWAALVVSPSAAPTGGDTAFGVKFSPDGSRYGVAVAVAHEGGVHVEAFPPTPMAQGLSPLADWLAERWRKVSVIVVDGKAGAGDLVNLLRARRVPASRILVAPVDKVIAANGSLLRHVNEGTLTHLGQEGLDLSVSVAARRDIGKGGGWGFAPATPDGDITPVECVALAAHGAVTAKPPITGAGRVGGNRAASTGRRSSSGRVASLA